MWWEGELVNEWIDLAGRWVGEWVTGWLRG